jgi:hypothetical protein
MNMMCSSPRGVFHLITTNIVYRSSMSEHILLPPAAIGNATDSPIFLNKIMYPILTSLLKLKTQSIVLVQPLHTVSNYLIVMTSRGALWVMRGIKKMN